MNPAVRFESEADAEYRSADRWYEDRRERLGMEFFDAVDDTIDRIVAMPRAGSLVPRMPADSPIRYRRFPYHVIYLETPTQIRILAVAHDRRKPGYWESRLK